MEIFRVPHGYEFLLVQFCPFFNQSTNAGRQMTIHYVERANVDHSSVFVVADVKVRRVVFIEIHADHDPEKTANFRHVTSRESPWPCSRAARYPGGILW